MRDNGNQVLFTSENCMVINENSGNLILKDKRHICFYKAYIMSSPENELSNVNALDIDSFMWHKKLEHVSFSLLNKLISFSLLNKLITKDLVLGLPKSKFKGKHL